MNEAASPTTDPQADETSRCAGCGREVTGPRDASAMNERWCPGCGGRNQPAARRAA